MCYSAAVSALGILGGDWPWDSREREGISCGDVGMKKKYFVIYPLS